MKKLTKAIKRKHKDYRPTIGIIVETPNGDKIKESVDFYYQEKYKSYMQKLSNKVIH